MESGTASERQFRPSGEFSNKEDGGLDLASVKAVCIIEVKDTHEGKTRR